MHPANIELFERITTLESLVRAHQIAMRGKKSNLSATSSNYRFMSQLLEIQSELINCQYRPLPYRHKIITDPKVRSIEAPAFRDRIVHHAVHQVLSPLYERFFIADSYACRRGKGTHKAMNRVQEFIKQQPNDYACKIDISKYYASINHAKLYQLLSKRLSEQKLLNLLATIIASHQSGPEYDHLFPADSPYHTKGSRGIPIGNLTSQLFANIYLHELDMFAKQQLKIRRYVRYMDDILFFHPDKDQLRKWQHQITHFLHHELHLAVNPRKVRIYPARLGVDFVGFVLHRSHRRVRASSVRRFRRRFHRQLKLLMDGKQTAEALEASLNAWTAHVTHGQGGGLAKIERRKLDNALFVVWVREKLAELAENPPTTPRELSRPHTELFLPTAAHSADLVDLRRDEAQRRGFQEI